MPTIVNSKKKFDNGPSNNRNIVKQEPKGKRLASAFGFVQSEVQMSASSSSSEADAGQASIFKSNNAAMNSNDDLEIKGGILKSVA